MSIQDPGNRPTGWAVAGDHERRIRALEALRQCCDDSGSPCLIWADCIVANPNLLAFWPLDDASGNAHDESGNGRTATVLSSDGFPVYGVDGPFTGISAIQFGGSSSFVGGRAKFSYSPDTTVNNAFDATNPWTVECFVYMDSHTDATIFSAWNGGANVGVAIRTDASGHITAQRRGGTLITSTAVVGLATWTHVRVTYSGTQLKVFIGGVQDGLLSDSGNMDGFGTILIGNGFLTVNISSPFQGRLADVAIFNAALTEFCDPDCEDGTIGALQGEVLTADGSGGTSYEFPTIEVLADGV